ncbi:MAG: S-methyl-5-thioribose-1-phosphate isomerase, partial [Planctomycetota bacterium]
MVLHAHPPTLRWIGEVDGILALLDQTRLPGDVVEISCRTVEDVWQAIRRLAVRGAPAIGVAAAYGVCLALRDGPGNPQAAVETACAHLASSRPTAVNLLWALERMRRVANSCSDANRDQCARRLLAEARRIHEEDRAMCAAIGRHGANAMCDLPEG